MFCDIFISLTVLFEIPLEEPFQIVTTSQFPESGAGLGISIFITNGILKPSPNPKQVPDCNDFCFSIISSVI